MKISAIVMAALGVASVFAASVYAASPREQFNAMIEQLQKNPSDNALREKIIRQAQELKPPPALPDDAVRREGRGKFAFRNAKSPEDYLDAAKEYEQAVTIAPWVPGYYSDLCVIHEKAGSYAEGKRNCEVYLKTLTDPAQITETRERIAGLEYAIEKELKKKQIRQKTADSLAGVWAIGEDNNRDEGPMRIKGMLFGTWNLVHSGQNQISITPFMSYSFDGTMVPRSDFKFRFAGVVDGTVIRGKIHIFGYVCADREYDVQGEVMRNEQAIKLNFYQEYDPRPMGAEGRCGRSNQNITFYLYRQ